MKSARSFACCGLIKANFLVETLAKSGLVRLAPVAPERREGSVTQEAIFWRKAVQVVGERRLSNAKMALNGIQRLLVVTDVSRATQPAYPFGTALQ